MTKISHIRTRNVHIHVFIRKIAKFQCAFVWSPYHHVLYLIFVIVSVLFIHIGLFLPYAIVFVLYITKLKPIGPYDGPIYFILYYM